METTNTELYWRMSPKGGIEFLKPFYDLSYKGKCNMVAPFMDALDAISMERLVKALLQHSPAKSKKVAPILGDRKQSPIARAADLREKEFEHLVA